MTMTEDWARNPQGSGGRQASARYTESRPILTVAHRHGELAFGDRARDHNFHQATARGASAGGNLASFPRIRPRRSAGIVHDGGQSGDAAWNSACRRQRAVYRQDPGLCLGDDRGRADVGPRCPKRELLRRLLQSGLPISLTVGCSGTTCMNQACEVLSGFQKTDGARCGRVRSP